MGGPGGLIERQVEVHAANQPVGDVIDTGLVERNLAQQQGFHSHELIRPGGFRLHGLDFLDHHVGGLADVLRVAGILYEICTAGAPGLQL